MQELTNDKYSDTKLYSIFHIELNLDIDNYMTVPPFEGASSVSFQYGEFVNKAQ